MVTSFQQGPSPHRSGINQTLSSPECIRTTVFHPGPYRTIAEVEYATAGWVD